MKALLVAVLLVCAFIGGAYLDHVSSAAAPSGDVTPWPAAYQSAASAPAPGQDPDIVPPSTDYFATPTPSRIIPVLPLSSWAGKIPTVATSAEAQLDSVPMPASAGHLAKGHNCLSDLLARGLSYTESSHICGTLESAPRIRR